MPLTLIDVSPNFKVTRAESEPEPAPEPEPEPEPTPDEGDPPSEE